MTRRRFTGTALAAGSTLPFAREGLAMTETAPPLKQRGYAPVNGLKMYYEVHGEDRGRVPLLLLHGSLGSQEMFRSLLPALTKSRQVLAARSAAISLPIRRANIMRPMPILAAATTTIAQIPASRSRPRAITGPPAKAHRERRAPSSRATRCVQ